LQQKKTVGLSASQPGSPLPCFVIIYVVVAASADIPQWVFVNKKLRAVLDLQERSRRVRILHNEKLYNFSSSPNIRLIKLKRIEVVEHVPLVGGEKSIQNFSLRTCLKIPLGKSR
jgi:hypothetical protein